MKDLIVLGTGAHNAEMVHIIARINRDRPQWNLLGVIADREYTPDVPFCGVPVLGGAEVLDKYPSAAFAVGNEWRGKAQLAPDRLATLIDPSAFVADTAEIGPGTVIYPNCFIGHNARLGKLVFMLTGGVVNHDDAIGDYCVFASGATLAGSVRVEEGCYLGQSCSVRQYLTIGRNSVIGMGSVVVKDVPPSSVMAGNPAKRLRDQGAPAVTM